MSLIRTVLAALLSIALTACASSSLKSQSAADSSAGLEDSVTPSSSGFIRPPQGRGAIMADLAISMLGQPYRFGGAAPGGFDCSGLVVYAAHGAGIRVPRTALEQLDSGTPLARRDLKAGDLVFMHLTHKELHVGIAIDEERFVHAPSRGGRVRIDSLAAPPYAGAFIAARRIITAR